MRSARLRRLTVLLLLAALLARGLVPSGWMPADVHAGTALIPCMMDGMHPSHPAPQAPHHQSERGDNTVCPFAAAAPLAAPLAGLSMPAPVAALANFSFGAPRDDLAASAVYRVNAARAPPAFV